MDRLFAAETLEVLRDAFSLREPFVAGTFRSCNTNLLIGDGDRRFVVRRSTRRKSLESLEFEVRLIEYLRGRDYPVPELVPDRHGNPYHDRDGAYYVVTRYVEGRTYDAGNPAHLEEAAHGLARFHQLARELPRPHLRRPGLQLPDWSDAEVRSPLVEIDGTARDLLSPEEYGPMHERLTHVVEQLGELLAVLSGMDAGLTRVIAHGSYGGTALIFDGDRLTAVLDFDRAGVDRRGSDLVYALKDFSRLRGVDGIPGWYRLDTDRYRRFLRAYTDLEPLPDVELQSLPLLLREQRLSKVLKKSDNFLRKLDTTDTPVAKLRKLDEVLVQEGRRLDWLSRHGAGLRI